MRNNHNRRDIRHHARVAMCAATIAVTIVAGGVAAADRGREVGIKVRFGDCRRV